jgi:Na+/H+ antiporter NhaD/arsenite permease-like protein
MEIPILIVFLIGYILIILERPLKISKAATALMAGVICWTLYALLDIASDSSVSLLHHLTDIAGILFFLIGAMTIVELIDAHNGFAILVDQIRTRSKIKLLWIIGLVTFFLSAVLDNLTTAIVMTSLLKKLTDDRKTRWLYAGIVIIAANAGGAWTPIGDVTTTMLWIRGQLPHSMNIITQLFLPSLTNICIPLILMSLIFRGEINPIREKEPLYCDNQSCSDFERNLIFTMGLVGLLFVPVFKAITNLPPFMGMLLSLGIIWLTTEVLHRSKTLETQGQLMVQGALKRIDSSTILFFLGILLAVSALQEAGLLTLASSSLKTIFAENHGIYAINMLIGCLSAVVDNVPLVAAAQGMYAIATDGGPFAPGGIFWSMLAYCAGTGGSILIIGSAAGVAVMGMEQIDFIWYAKKISWLAVAGYIAGAVVFILTN